MRDGTHLSLCRPLLLKSLVSASSEASVEERCCILQKAFEELRHLLSAKSSPEQKTSAQTAFSRPSINDSQQCSSLPLRAVNNRVMLSAPADQEAVLTSGGLNTHLQARIQSLSNSITCTKLRCWVPYLTNVLTNHLAAGASNSSKEPGPAHGEQDCRLPQQQAGPFDSCRQQHKARPCSECTKWQQHWSQSKSSR
jgi:hypothetical protein